MTTTVINNVPRSLLEVAIQVIDDYGRMNQQYVKEAFRALLATAQPAADGEREDDGFERYRLASKFCTARGLADDDAARPIVVDAFASGFGFGAALPATTATFAIGDHVRKTKGSRWQGIIVGTYSTALTPEGYAVESDTETGSVQIYPVSALERVANAQANT